MEFDDYKVRFSGKECKYIQVYNNIKSMILEGKLNSNDKLPPIRKLASFLDVNNVTVVKAYELLESDGYVNKRVGSGTFISSKSNGYSKRDIDEDDQFYRLDSGNPSPEIFPITDFKKAINMALEEDDASIFNYDEGNGITELKEVMVRYLKNFDINTTSDNLMVISGAQQGIDIVAKTLINYSDIVFIEEPTYAGAIDVLKSRGSKLVPIPMLEDGIDIGVLKMKLDKIRPKMIYVMPNFQNPTGITYSESKKKKLIELAEEYEFYILEDDFISDFKFLATNNKTLKSYDKYNRVIYIKSFSKILMPGLRVGVMDIPTELMNRAMLSKYNSDISTSTLIQKSLYYYMDKFDWKKHISVVEKIYTKKFIECYSYINKRLGQRLKVIKTDGGINFFIELSRGYFSRDFVDFMLEKRVVLQPGSIYFDNEIDDRFFRINIARESVERIKDAVDIIADNLDDFYRKFNKIPIKSNSDLQ
ncbi:MAG: PLP-dependent aminotransferase family protein [Peptostreptococcus sp.]|uniref:MocR-like pyridoxine biosynthesis transcription factor PdxR n=1 Tax=Peptostreptococcus sp. TaxID=1262 RepID=UPI002FC9BC17